MGPPDTIELLPPEQDHPTPLSPREMQIVLNLAAGRSLSQIARAHAVSISTVRNDLKRAMRATATHSQTHLVSTIRDWLY